MRKYNLNFISDDDLYHHVKNTVVQYRTNSNIGLKKFTKNHIDPIKLTFDSKVFTGDMLEAIESEISRQLDKSNSNNIGYFHQNIFKHIGTGWEVPKKGFDIINRDKNYFVEMKNKHNTMNSDAISAVYSKMLNQTLESPGAICYLVEVIAKDSQDIVWNATIKKKVNSNKNIRKISIDKFYELVTGQSDAFMKLCEQLPTVIDDIVSDLELNKEDEGDVLTKSATNILTELEGISDNTLKSLYLLSFKEYKGFKNFNI